MYESFYHLQANPFRLTPDPLYCFIHSGYKMAREYLEYALKLGEGFVMVTGRPGTGKTTLAETFLATLDMNTVAAARIAASNLDSEDLLRTVAYAYGLEAEGHDKATLRHLLQQFFEKQVQSGRRVLLVIDEAQGLPRAALEELRLLADLHSESRQLLQLFLVGQETLREQMSAPEMEHFQQRVIANYHLVPLGLMETRAYVEYRLRQAGWQGDPELTGGAVVEIYRCSRGVPRHINKLCNRLLLLGYGEGSHKLDVEHVQAIAAEMDEEQLQPMDSESSDDEAADGTLDIPDFDTGSLSVTDLDIRVKGQTVIGAVMSTVSAGEDIARPAGQPAEQCVADLPGPEPLYAARQSVHVNARRLPGMSRWRVKLASSMVMLTVATLSIAAVTSILDNEENRQGVMQNGRAERPDPLPANSGDQQAITSIIPGDTEQAAPGPELLAGPVFSDAVQVRDAGEQYPAAELMPDTAPASVAGTVLASLEPIEIIEPVERVDLVKPAEPAELVELVESAAPAEPEAKATTTAQAMEIEVPTIDSQTAEIEDLIAQGQRALKNFRLLTPADNSAHYYFNSILKLEPDNAEAHAGIEQIVARYELLANKALEQNNEKKADRYIARGLSIRPDSSELLALQNRSSVPIVSLSVEEGVASQPLDPRQQIGEFFSRVKTFLSQQ